MKSNGRVQRKKKKMMNKEKSPEAAAEEAQRKKKKWLTKETHLVGEHLCSFVHFARELGLVLSVETGVERVLHWSSVLPQQRLPRLTLTLAMKGRAKGACGMQSGVNLAWMSISMLGDETGECRWQ